MLQLTLRDKNCVDKTTIFRMFLRDILSAMNQRLLLVLIPLSFVLHAIEADPRVVFLVSLFAIVPLVEVMGIATVSRVVLILPPRFQVYRSF